MKGRVLAVNSSDIRGVVKTNVKEGYLKKDWGLVGDAHAGVWDRQVSILPIEAMELIPPDKKETVDVEGYTENITIQGIPLDDLPVGTRVRIGDAEVLIRHIGKEHPKDEGRPYIVSRQGRFGTVTRGGAVRVGDPVELVEK